MRKKFSSLPLIRGNKIKYNNFYSVCIKAIKINRVKIMDRSECIKSIEKLRDKSFIKNRKTFFSRAKLGSSNWGAENKAMTFRANKISSKKKTLFDILKECQKIEMKKIRVDSSQLNLPDQENNKDIDENKENEEKRLKSGKMVKIPKRISSINPEEMKSNVNVNASLQPKPSSVKDSKNIKNLKEISKPYAIFKKIIEYLESNNITLFEYIKHNPFQKKPYQIPKSFEFLSAVKFKNYDYVIEALQYNRAFLFSFDYYGQTCYHWAAKLSNEKMLSLLMDFGKYLNQKDFKGRTPLYLAAINGDKKICELLLKNGANVHLSDDYGLTPANVATNKELRYYLGDFITQNYSNLSYKQRVADYLRVRNEKIEERRAMERLKKMEEEEKRKKEKENEEEEEENNEEDE